MAPLQILRFVTLTFIFNVERFLAFTIEIAQLQLMSAVDLPRLARPGHVVELLLFLNNASNISRHNTSRNNSA